jgi:16S rRNA processing protein RimM
VVLGVLVRPVGLRGEIKLRLSGDFWEAALGSQHLTLVRGEVAQPVDVESARPGGAAAQVLKLRSVDNRDAAQALVGMELVLAAGPLDVEAPEELLGFQVCGFRVETMQGDLVGDVAAVEAMPAQDLLVVQGPRGEHRVPMVPAIVCEIDLEAGVVRIDPPAGLLEL